MIINTIILLEAISSSVLLCYFTNTYDRWYFIVLFVLIIPFMYMLWTIIYLLFLSFISLFLKKDDNIKKPNKFIYFFVKEACYQIMFIFRIVVRRNKANYPKEKCLIVCNHMSNFDLLPIMWYGKSKPILCITKQENMKIPLIGKFMRYAGFVDIDRNNDFKAIKSLLKASEMIKSDYSSYIVCPEGTRNKTLENGMLEWKPGCFKIAYKAKCPIVVVSIKNTNRIKNNWYKLFSKVEYNICEIIQYEKYEVMNSIELSDYCKKLIEND